MKSLEREGFITAHEIAVRKGYDDLVPILEPKPHHIIPGNSLQTLEGNVHSLMQSLAGDKVSQSYCFPSHHAREYYSRHYPDPKTRHPSPSTISHDGDGHSDSFPMDSHPHHVRSKFPLSLSS